MIVGAFLAVTSAHAEGGDKILSSAFEIASREYGVARGIPARFFPVSPRVTTIVLEESPSLRWNASWGSYPKFVAEVLGSLGDTNAAYEGRGQVRVSYGPRKVLVDTLQRFSAELRKRGLRFEPQMLSRDLSRNGHGHGDVNSDHMIGLAADGRVVVPACAGGIRCSERAELTSNELEVQTRIMAAAAAAGAQQLNMYGGFRDGPGQWIHIGTSPFRNGSMGETLDGVRADGTRRIGYGSAQRGAVGALTSEARWYVGQDGMPMAAVFEKLLHNAPPPGNEAVYNAIRDRNLDWIEDVMD